MTTLQLILARPGRYVPLACKYALTIPLRMLSRLLRHSAFFVQEQMDIHPKSMWHDRIFTENTGGFFVPGDPARRTVADLDPWDTVRRDMLALLLRSVVARGIPGDLAELGVYKGATARLLHHYMPDRMLHLFDTFAGFDQRDIDSEKERTGLEDSAAHYSDTSVEAALRRIRQKTDNIRIHRGYFPESVPSDLDAKQFAFVHLDADLYDPVLAGLKYFYGRVPPGGLIVVHDYNAWPGPRKAVEDFFRDKREVPIPMPDKNGSALIVKS